MLLLKQLFRLRESVQEHSRQAAGESAAEMPLLDHLEDLRRCLLRMMLTAALSMLLCFGFAPQMMQLLLYPAQQLRQETAAQALPEGCDAEDYLLALRYLRTRAQLNAETDAALRTKLPAPVLLLADAAQATQAVRLLNDSSAQEELLKQVIGPEEEKLAVALSLLRQPEAQTPDVAGGREMMGAFQPGEAFLLSLSMAFFGGLFLSFPLQAYFLLRFIVPGLREKERRLLYRCVAAAFALFISGAAFAYFLVLPRVLGFFFRYSLSLGIANEWRIGYYLSFAAKLIFVFGAIFELPVILMPLLQLGIVSTALLRRSRPYAFIACLALALLLAPAPDPGTMLLMALPMYALFELCLLFALLNEKRRAKA